VDWCGRSYGRSSPRQRRTCCRSTDRPDSDGRSAHIPRRPSRWEPTPHRRPWRGPSIENEEAPQMRGFRRAAEGIRTLDLLHGKQNVCFPLALEIPCKPAGSRVWVSSCDPPAFTGRSRGFRHPMGTQQPYGGRPHWSSSRTSSLILRAMSSRIALTSSSGRPAGSWRSQSKTHHDPTRHIGYGVWFLRETVCDRPDPGFPLCFSKPEARVRGGGRIDASIFRKAMPPCSFLWTRPNSSRRSYRRLPPACSTSAAVAGSPDS